MKLDTNTMAGQIHTVFDTLKSIEAWFKQAVPTPTDRTRAIQLGCHFEEFVEMMESGGGISSRARMANLEVADALKVEGSIPWDTFDQVALADALADSIVTAIGVAHMFGIDLPGALREVNASNWSKFVDGSPILDANGKIAKASGYRPPDLTAFVSTSQPASK